MDMPPVQYLLWFLLLALPTLLVYTLWSAILTTLGAFNANAPVLLTVVTLAVLGILFFRYGKRQEAEGARMLAEDDAAERVRWFFDQHPDDVRLLNARWDQEVRQDEFGQWQFDAWFRTLDAYVQDTMRVDPYRFPDDDDPDDYARIEKAVQEELHSRWERWPHNRRQRRRRARALEAVRSALASWITHSGVRDLEAAPSKEARDEGDKAE
jgi:hypothetical protein